MPNAQLSDLKEILKRLKPKTVFVFHGKNSYAYSNYKPVLEEYLQPYKTTFYSDCASNPTIEDISRAIVTFKAATADLVIAIGGGSIMDTAKLARFFSHQTISLTDYFIDSKPANIQQPDCKFICIPTTSGTGSESTQFATFYIDKRKYSLDTPSCLPDYKILDEKCIVDLPIEIAKTTGLDALCHALESLWAKGSTEKSRDKSLTAIHMILENFENRLQNPTKENSRKLLLAASLAGEAIQVARTTASHAISYPLTSVYGIPHGDAVAMTIKQLLKFNEDVIPNNIKLQTIKALKLSSFTDLYDKLSNLFEKITVKTKLADYAIDIETAMPIILEYVSIERLSNNPKPLTTIDIKNFLNGKSFSG